MEARADVQRYAVTVGNTDLFKNVKPLSLRLLPISESFRDICMLLPERYEEAQDVSRARPPSRCGRHDADHCISSNTLSIRGQCGLSGRIT